MVIFYFKQQQKVPHLRDSMFRDGGRLEHDSSGAQMEFTLKFNLSRTWTSPQIKQNVLLGSPDRQTIKKTTNPLTCKERSFYRLFIQDKLSCTEAPPEQNQHDDHDYQHTDLRHELLHVVFSLKDKRPQIVERDVVLHILSKAMVLHIDLRNEGEVRNTAME